jgi:NAD(P)-dependent dehydrogenase (short-subunit alcohol dehydrogenase family)
VNAAAVHRIFVTGGSKGIGEAIVRDCLAEGAKGSFVDIDFNNWRKASRRTRSQC